MIRLVSDYIITPLGEGIGPNLRALSEGRTALRLHAEVHGQPLVCPVMASLLEEDSLLIRTDDRLEDYSLFERFSIRAAEGACAPVRDALASDRTIFILSSTKGDIWTPMAETAARIARHFGNTVEPLVVSTACTSGVSAQLAAQRLLEAGLYDTAVVIGCDIQQEFIVSGFQSFHALSTERCRPFDAHRDGLNAGEAAACMVLRREDAELPSGKSGKSGESGEPGESGNTGKPGESGNSGTTGESGIAGTAGTAWYLLGGSIHNDANHISGPSRTAEGSLRCLEDALALAGKENIACVSVHGTATLYNDEMESIALHRAGLSDVPVVALKGYYGHTMGAAGLLETILTLHTADEGLLLPALGYSEQGTTYAVNLSAERRQMPPASEGTAIVKLLSGFGGVNAGAVWQKRKPWLPAVQKEGVGSEWQQAGEIRIDEQTDLVAAYRSFDIAYPKFFKMDTLSRLTFVALEMLLRETGFAPDKERTALLLASRSASLKNDTDYRATIADHQNYYPSPALFVYTLPNIAAGEAAIRHGLFGETSCYAALDEQSAERILQATLMTTDADSLIVGWTECPSAEHYEAHMRLFIRSHKWKMEGRSPMEN